MASNSSIEWTESTWNPVVGCAKVSAGCKNCYAERMAKRLIAISNAAIEKGRNPGRAANYLGTINKQGHWSGNVYLDHAALNQPSLWKMPRLIFVNSMSDLFQDAVPFDFIQKVFKSMNESPMHTFQVLTKHPHNAARYASKLEWSENIWIGTSVEDARFTSRIHYLRRINASVRFLSVEPLLGPIPRLPLSNIDWVIVGGESGPGARTINPEWVRKIRDRCISRQVPFFFKQWGGVNKKKAGRLLDGRTWDEMPVGQDDLANAFSR